MKIRRSVDLPKLFEIFLTKDYKNLSVGEVSTLLSCKWMSDLMNSWSAIIPSRRAKWELDEGKFFLCLLCLVPGPYGFRTNLGFEGETVIMEEGIYASISVTMTLVLHCAHREASCKVVESLLAYRGW